MLIDRAAPSYVFQRFSRCSVHAYSFPFVFYSDKLCFSSSSFKAHTIINQSEAVYVYEECARYILSIEEDGLQIA